MMKYPIELLEYSKLIFFRDIKPENILLESKDEN